MNSTTALIPTKHRLAHRGIVRIPHGAGAHIAVQSGSVWITQEGDAQDLVLEPGQAVQLERPGMALVYALEPSSVLVERHAEPRPAPAPITAKFAEMLAARWTSPLHAFAQWG